MHRVSNPQGVLQRGRSKLLAHGESLGLTGTAVALAAIVVVYAAAQAATPPIRQPAPRLELDRPAPSVKQLSDIPPAFDPPAVADQAQESLPPRPSVAALQAEPQAPALQEPSAPVPPVDETVVHEMLGQQRPLAAPPEPKLKGAFPRGLHPVIKHSMVEASRFLPEGWRLEFMNALRDGPGWNGPHGKRDHTGGALAVDVWLVNQQGERLCNFKCSRHFDDYRRFMEMVKFIQDRDFPAYREVGRWGGYFSGRYANDAMHYDLEPSGWTAAGNWEKGLYPKFAHYAVKGDAAKGMGPLASYRLPGEGPDRIFLAQLPPVDLMPPLAVPQRAKVRGQVIAKASRVKPQRYAQRARFGRRTIRDGDGD